MKSGIYKITNKVNGKVYVGSAALLTKRLGQHKLHLKNGVHCNKKLQRAWDKYGKEAFKFEALIISTPDNMLMYEQRCIDGYNAVENGYNIQPIAGNSSGRIVSSETRQKMSIARTGMKRSPSTRELLRLGKIGNKSRLGMPHNEETKRKMSAASKGRKKSPEHRENLRGNKNMLGKKHSEATLKKMSDARKLYYQRKREAKAQLTAEQSLASSD